MSLTKEERQANMAKAREAKQAKAIIEDNGNTETIIVNDIVSNGKYEVVSETLIDGFRVIVTENGLHRAEWQGDWESCIAQAQAFIDSGDFTGAVNVNAAL